MESSHKTETYKSLIQISLEGFRYLALLNGATWLTVLAFADRDGVGVDAIRTCGIKLAVALFIVSLTLTAFCYLSSWATQLCLHNENLAKSSKGRYQFPEGRHRIPMWITVVLFIMAAAVYFAAASVALFAM